MAYNLILQESIKTAIKNNDYNSVREFLTEDEFKKIKSGNFAILVNIVNKSTKLTPTNSKVENLYNTKKEVTKKPIGAFKILKSFFGLTSSGKSTRELMLNAANRPIVSGGLTASCDYYTSTPRSGTPGVSGMQGISGYSGKEYEQPKMTSITGAFVSTVPSGVYSYEQSIHNEWNRMFTPPPPPNEIIK